MPTIFQKKKPSARKLGPIRGSILLLISKLVLTVIFLDTIYYVFFYFSTIWFNAPDAWQDTLSLGLLTAQFFIDVIQIVFIVYFILNWSHTTYYIDGAHLIKHSGVMTTEEDVYDLATVRSVEVHQSFLGMVLNFGDLILKTSASGGYQVVVILKGVSKPIHWEREIKNYF
ncbi:MAG: PH domain-containing protein [Candidatus Levybacteria bacterium]|nr:PH domain-containing protein [Candidatus Levybacteria bacterium]